MVKICSNTYQDKTNKHAIHFEKYSFPLSSFQKYAIESIVEGHHILVTAHTGSGKTLPAEFAIEHFVNQGKKVIYTSPIKALSNQKFYEFTKKFPDISFGVITGDIKCNPEAQVLIMTTEILLNKLYQLQTTSISTSSTSSSSTSFDMDIQNELACVIFDEVHYINDKDRGHVWEQSIMMLPLHIQMVMLSATLDKPENFALWCETRPQVLLLESEKKIVYLTTTYERVVPLTHYSFITVGNAIFKAIKDKVLEKEIRDMINQPYAIQNSKGVFDELYYFRMQKMLKLFEDKRVFVKRTHVVNQVCKYMVDNNMLPALCFVLSRKQLEICAKEVTVVLLEDDSKVPYIIKRECEEIIRKLPNFKEYLELPEYLEMVSLLEKGIAIHHAGIMPVLREMVELLYSRGYVKLLFATETFAVGINMPTKTVIFTDVNKFDGTGMRMLHSHEYTQMAGRAGRRGLDTVGNVIHLNNLFKNVDCNGYKCLMNGKPQKLVSKFKISYNLLLNLIDIGRDDFVEYAKRSMIQENITTQLGSIYGEMNRVEGEAHRVDETVSRMRTPKHVVDEYISLLENRNMASNKKRKEIERNIQMMKDGNKFLLTDVKTVENYNEKHKEYGRLETEYKNTENYLKTQVDYLKSFLMEEGFVLRDLKDLKLTLTLKGMIASQLREIHCLSFADLIERKVFENLSSVQLIGIFSCFSNISVPEDFKQLLPGCQDASVKKAVTELKESYDKYSMVEEKSGIHTGIDYNMHYDIIDYVMQWCNCSSVEECKFLLQTMEKEKDIFLGEFVKALLKINNVSSEMEKVAEKLGDVALLSCLRSIPDLTLKYVATNQSLYV